MDIPKKTFNAPFKKSNRVGGVMTPPYENKVLDITAYYKIIGHCRTEEKRVT